jgi:hypothetical protein
MKNINPLYPGPLPKPGLAKITSTDLKADASEVAIESMELAHEGLTIVEAKK